MSFKTKVVYLAIVLALGVQFCAAAEDGAVLPQLDNPISVQYLQQHLKPQHPRLVYTPEMVGELKAGVETDPVLENLYASIRLNADAILRTPPLRRRMVGRRLLHTSREMLYRVNMLGVVVLVEGDENILKRLDREILAVCAFSDWNPDHFLDVAEMSLAVALALDWADGRLPESTVEIAKTALVEKGLRPSWPEDGSRFGRAYGDNNWNQVCNGGLVAAALAVAEQEPALAAKTLHRALEGMPYALRQYAPDGVYPEGATYWSYGTSFTVITAAMLETALGTDFGLYEVPGLRESAVFRSLSVAPSGLYYNFADCGDERDRRGDATLAWFAAKSGNAAFFEQERFLLPPSELGKPGRLDGAALAWIARFEPKESERMPEVWKGDGPNPIVIFKSGADDPHRYYFGGKGGQATSSHGNMDAGSFVFELDGVRWVLDPGNQGYHALEKTGFNLWGRAQDSQRWTLLTKNNFGHSTLTVNDELFVANAFAPLIEFGGDEAPSASFDLSGVYGTNVVRAVRQFVKDSPVSLVVEDRITVSGNTDALTWQLITTADVEMAKGGAILRQGGESLRLVNQTHPDLKVSVVSLDPPPLKLDRRIDGLKRVEIRIPATVALNGKIAFRVRLVKGDQGYE